MNAYEVEAGIGVLQVTLCDPCPRWFFSTVSMPERLECDPPGTRSIIERSSNDRIRTITSERRSFRD